MFIMSTKNISYSNRENYLDKSEKILLSFSNATSITVENIILTEIS